MSNFYRTPRQIEAAYAAGLPGWQFNQDTMDDLFLDGKAGYFFDERYPVEDGIRCLEKPTEESKSKFAFLWRSREKYDPGAFGHEQQTTGDCVSHGSRGCRETTRCVEFHIKGEPEMFYKRSATEPTYGARGHGGQGMDPARASRFEADYGFMFREKYPSVDLSKYNSKIGTSWGRSGVPNDVKEDCKKHNVGKWIAPQSVEDAKELLFSGYAIHSGQSYGVKPKSDSRGISVTGSSWNHDMATIGYDNTREVYPECVFLVANSWGVWNQQPAVWPVERYGEWPIGSFWVPEDVYGRKFVGNNSIFAYCDIAGVPQKQLPDYGKLDDILG